MKFNAKPWIPGLLVAGAALMIGLDGHRSQAAVRPIYDMGGHWTGTYRATGGDTGVIDAHFHGGADGGRAVQGGFTMFSDFGLVYPFPTHGKLHGKNVLRLTLKNDDGLATGSLRGVISVRANRMRANFSFRDVGRVIRGTMVIHKDY